MSWGLVGTRRFSTTSWRISVYTMHACDSVVSAPMARDSCQQHAFLLLSTNDSNEKLPLYHCVYHRCVQVRSMRIASTRAPDTCRCHASLVWRVACRPGVTNFPPSFCLTAAAMLLPKPYTHAPYTTAPSVGLGSLRLLRLAPGCRAGAAGAGAGASQRGGQERAVVRTPPPPLSRPRVYSTPFLKSSARCMYNRAVLLERDGRLVEAEDTQRRCLQLRQRVLGEDHQQVSRPAA